MNNLTKLRRTPHTSTVFQKVLADLKVVRENRDTFQLTQDRPEDFDPTEIHSTSEALEASELRLENSFIDYLNVLLGAR